MPCTERDIMEIESCDLMISISPGRIGTAGTNWEQGYAYQAKQQGEGPRVLLWAIHPLYQRIIPVKKQYSISFSYFCSQCAALCATEGQNMKKR